MIGLTEVIVIHDTLIKKFGGKDGLRDVEALKSSLLRPYQTFDNKELYPYTVDKASALIESLIKNHPFVDGNKRVGYVCMRLTLLKEKHDIQAAEDEKYSFVMQIANGTLSFEAIKKWINDKLD
ncbi:MAG: Fic family protein [Bacteroidales bacterium]|nr:Fic family protein [Bacteroidales bacterium]MCF8334367.1 Fic family protein [Bacteroidales bacterium]